VILIVSDIHLADTAERETVDLESLCATIRAEAARAKDKKYPFKVLLLGDIFEILKSQVWHERDVRPWDSCSAKHIEAVTEIFEKIIANNADFFSVLKALPETAGDGEVVYVPGNHDWPLNGNMGAPARKRLIDVAGLRHRGGRPFPYVFTDVDHSLWASHGHEHDSANKTDPKTISLGDAIVIEVLLVLPELVAKSLGCKSSDPQLKFLHELDNVRPQSVGAMVSWLLLGAQELKHPDASTAIARAIRTVVGKLNELRKRGNASDAWEQGDKWVGGLVAAADFLLKKKDLLPMLAKLGGGGEESYASFGFLDLSRSFSKGNKPRFRHVAHGHTHLPEHTGLALDWASDAKPSVYLNTGTWRRVHRFGRRRDKNKSPYFAEFKEETCVVLYRKGEYDMNSPSYEFRRIVRG
jgi:UDP-2,3-diacylglucosamine pyrophosphatase LpxH